MSMMIVQIRDSMHRNGSRGFLNQQHGNVRRDGGLPGCSPIVSNVLASVHAPGTPDSPSFESELNQCS
jgi:hypothetical protein